MQTKQTHIPRGEKRNKSLVRVGLLSFVILAIGSVALLGLLGYRLSPEAAAKAHGFLESGAKDHLVVETASGPVYIFEESDGYRTLYPIHFGPLWVANASSSTQAIEDEGDAIRTMGYTSLEGHGVINALVAFKVDDEDVAYIEAGPESERIRTRVLKGEPVIIQYRSRVSLNALNALALTSDGEISYRLSFNPQTPDINDPADFRWRKK